MKVFFLKLLLILILPIAIVAGYFINDPFRVLYHYDSYMVSGKPYHIILDKDFVSSQTFLNNFKKYNYDSYIFGNSRAGNYMIADWKPHINSDKCFHFDGSCESIYAIGKNVEFVKKQGAHIKNALFILDYNILQRVTENPGHLFLMDPEVSGKSKLEFQLTFLRDYLDPTFIKAYYGYLLKHKLNPAHEVPVGDMLNYARDTRTYDPVTNEVYFEGLEQAITRNRDSFYNARASYFTPRDTVQRYDEPIIGTQQAAILKGIQTILAQDGTDYRIIISPPYNQNKMNPKDLAILHDIFGKEHVFDFSGINQLTANKYNYYESFHYRPLVAKMIMDSVYKEK